MNISKKASAVSCKKPKITYPCMWAYKVIGREPHKIEAAIREACAPDDVEIRPSHSSGGGKYHSFNVELAVRTEEQRLAIYQALHNHSDIKIVL